MKASAEKSSSTTSTNATHTASQPFFAKAGGGNFFAPAATTAPAVQFKMTVNKPGDKFEQEADTMANKVMRMPTPVSPVKEEKLQKAAMPEEKVQKKEEDKLQKAAMPEEKIQKKEDDKLQKAAMPEEKIQKKEDKLQKAVMPEEKIQKKEDDKLQKAPATEEKLQRKGDGTPAVGASTQAAITSKTSGGQPLSADVRSYMEPRFNADFSNVRVHNDPESASLSNQLSARAFTHQNHVFFSQDQYQPGTGEGKQLLAHELTHTIQQGHAIQRSPQVSTTTTPPPIQREWSLPDIDIPNPLEYLAKKATEFINKHAEDLPGFTMLTVVMGKNPLTGATVDRSPGNILRGAIKMIPGGGFVTQALDNHGVFEKVSAWTSQQFNTLKEIGSNILTDVKNFVSKFSITDLKDPGAIWAQAQAIITAPIAQIKNFAAGLVEGIAGLIKDAILKPIAKFAKANLPNAYDLLSVILGKDPISGETVTPSAENLIAPVMKMIGQEDVWTRMKEANAIPRAFAWFQSTVGEAKTLVSSIPEQFIAAFKALTIEDIILIANAFSKIAGVFGSVAGTIIKWGGDKVWKLLEIVFDVVSPGAFGYIKKTGAALKSILKNPLPFVGNLVNAAKLGFQNFAGNFVGHLKAGLIDWLTGSLTGVYIPKALSLPEMGKFAMSVLGITWAQIRGKIVKALGPTGETIMKGLETGFDIVVALITGGPAAAWELIKEKLTDLKDMVVGGIIDFVTDTVVKKAIPKLIAMFIPGAGFISAIISIYDTVMVFVQKISKIIQVVTGFINSIVAIASGNIAAAASRVEGILANLLSLAISFLAGFAGLGKVSDKIMGVIGKVRGTIDKALDWIINTIVSKAKAWFAKLFGKKDKKDERTDEQKMADLERGLSEGDALLTVPELDNDKVKSRLPGIKNKYKLSKLELVIDSESGDEETVHLHGEVNPVKDKPKHKVKKGGPDSIISQQDLSFSRPNFRPSTKKQLRSLHIKQKGSKNIMDTKGTFKSPKKWHRRHVVSWGDIKTHFISIFSGKTVRDAAAILASEGYSGKLERQEVVRFIKEKARNAFNDEKNLFIDLGQENSSLQDVLDDAHPDFLDQKGKIVEAKIDERVAAFIASHAIGGNVFAVNTKIGVVDWDVTYV